MRLFREFFYFQKSDRQVIIALLIVIAVALVLIYLTGEDYRETAAPPAVATADSIDTLLHDDGRQPFYRNRDVHGGRAGDYGRATAYGDEEAAAGDGYYQQPERKAERFAFDPNTADSTQLLRLGLKPWQVKNIYRYRAAGGVYTRPQDFAQLYGLTLGQYRELEPYIRIAPQFQPAARRVKAEKPYERDTIRFPDKIGKNERIVLNLADTAMLRHVPGIGVYYAKQILAYGQRLGGYVSVDQLDEIDDLPDGVKQYFVIKDAETRKLNVNRLSINELKRHPYISYYQAKAIVSYRRIYGPIKDLNDLVLHTEFTPEAIKRIEPYVEY
jgi:DNA uptake protein ComE-like DNA-binding protein